MTKRLNIASGSPFEETFGYCRAVKTGNLLEISGTVALIDGEKVTADDFYAQTYNIIEQGNIGGGPGAYLGGCSY